MSFRLKAITRAEHRAFVTARPSASHMQVPSWGDVKPDWRAESLGWFGGDGGLVGVGLVLFRPLPKLKRYLANLPEGPVIDWAAPDLEQWLEPMLAYLKAQGAFSVKMGPPAVARRWSAEAVKAAIADPKARRLRDAEASPHEPRAFDIADRPSPAGRWRMSSAASTSSGAATLRKQRKQASRSSSAATTICPPPTISTWRPPNATGSSRALWPTSSACGPR